MVRMPAAVASVVGRNPLIAANAIFDFGTDAEPHRQHRIQHDQRHRVGTGCHRQQQRAQLGQPADQCTREDTAATGEHQCDRHLAERDAERFGILRPIGNDDPQRVRQWRQEQR